MARGLATLIRVRKWELDEKQRQLGEMLAELEALHGQARALEAEIRHEQQVAATAEGMVGFSYGAFAERALAQRQALADRIAAKDSEIDAFRDQVAAAFRALKTAEITERTRLERERRQAERKEQAVLDELGAQAHMRRDRTQ